MLQRIQGLDVYVVDFDIMPELPITGTGEVAIYAEALTAAFQNGDIIEPGKYGVHVDAETKTYNIFKIIE